MAFYRLLGRTGDDPPYGTPPCARTPHRAVRPKSPSCGAARGGTRWMLLAAAHRIAGGASGEHIVFAFYKRASLATNAARRAASTESAVQGVAHGQAWAAAQRVPRGFAAHSAPHPATTAANRAETLARRTANRAEMLARRTVNRAEMPARLQAGSGREPGAGRAIARAAARCPMAQAMAWIAALRGRACGFPA